MSPLYNKELASTYANVFTAYYIFPLDYRKLT